MSDVQHAGPAIVFVSLSGVIAAMIIVTEYIRNDIFVDEVISVQKDDVDAFTV